MFEILFVFFVMASVIGTGRFKLKNQNSWSDIPGWDIGGQYYDMSFRFIQDGLQCQGRIKQYQLFREQLQRAGP